MKRAICFFLVALSALLTMGKGCEEGPKGSWEVSPKLICPGERARIAWKLSNATDARISPDIGNVDPNTGVTDTDPLNVTTKYKLEAMNNQVPWMQINGTKTVIVVGTSISSTSWPIGAQGVDVGGGNCEWKTTVPDNEVSAKVRINGLISQVKFSLSITHIHPTQGPKTGSVGPGGTTPFFDGRPVVGDWIFVPMPGFMEKIKDEGWDLCKGYPITITVGVTCK